MHAITKQRSIPIEEVAQEVITHLINEFGGKIDTKTGKYWQGGRCPGCNKKSLWTLVDKPLLPRCDHEAKCGHSISTRDQYPELFEDLTQRFQATAANPNATADAYMRMLRGFDIAQLNGWYTQDKYWNPNGDRGTATVRFWLNNEKTIGWEKFVDDVNVTDVDKETGEISTKRRDSRFIGSFTGMAWTPANILVEPGKRIYIVEGIFDAIALYLSGKRNVCAIMTCGNFPTHIVEAYKNADAIWVLALDADKAGRKHTLSHIKQLEKLGQQWEAIQPARLDNGLDWNDLYNRSQLADYDFDRYRYYGELLTSISAEQTALATWRFTESNFFVFDYGNRMYNFKYDLAAYDKACDALRQRESLDEAEALSQSQREQALLESQNLTRLGNCKVDFRYTQTDPVESKTAYFFRVDFPDGRMSSGQMSASDALTATKFRDKIADIAPGALIKAKPETHEWMLERWFGRIRDIQTVPYVGYVEAMDAYVFKDFGAKNGRIFPLNKDEYINFGKGKSIKSAYHSVKVQPNPELKQYNADWLDDLYAGWGVKGIVALAYWTVSLIATQVRRKQTNIAFLEIVGDAGTGKSTLIEFLWRLFGRCDDTAYEGFDPSSVNRAFISRQLASVSNIPTVFIESEREKGGFDWDNVKKLYGGNSPLGRGKATQGNETSSEPFRGTLVIAQNSPVDASEAVLQRLCHIAFKREEATNASWEAAQNIQALQLNELSGYLIKCLSNIKDMTALFFKEQRKFESHIRNQPWSHTPRIALNHSQLAAAVSLLEITTDIGRELVDEAQQYIINTMAQQREQAIKRDHPFVEQFFGVVRYLEEVMEESPSKLKTLNHYKGDGDTVALRLGEVYEQARKYNQDLPAEIDLKRALKNSRRYEKHNYPTTSQISGKTVRCWHFKKAD